MSNSTLFVRQENGRYRAASHLEVAHEAAKALYEASVTRKDASVLTSPEVTRDYLKLRLAFLEHEVFGIVFLDNRHRVINYTELFRGTIDGSSVHPREVVKEVLAQNAAAVIFAHNHPSGACEPSQADMRITQRLKDALALVDVRVLDHVIIGGNCSLSFAERGLL
ncbi:MAG: DNA repair protein RadC [Candidatus Competibacteraceae bacterium]|nr:DNA repair protein RadC [Candidatus Competibacteraceae bacterium]